MATDPDAALHRAKAGFYKPAAADHPQARPTAAGTLADTVEQLPDLRGSRPTSAPIEDPASLGDVFSASKRVARADRTDFDEIRIRDGYQPIIDALGLPTSENPAAFFAPDPATAAKVGSGAGPSRLATAARQGESPVFGSMWSATRDLQESLIAGEIRKRRAKDPKFLAGVPDTVDGLHRYFLEQEGAKRRSAEGVLARSPGGPLGFGAQLGGGALEMFHDPINLVTLPIGGGGKTIAQTIFRETLINGALELAQQPIVAANRAELGEHLTLGEAAANTVTAGIAGGALEGAAKGVGKAISATGIPAAAASKIRQAAFALAARGMQIELNPKVPIDRALAELDNRQLVAIHNELAGGKLTPDEKAAAAVLERNQEIGETSPYEPGPVGDGLHEAGLAAAIKAVTDGLPVEDQVAEAGRPAFAEARPPEGLSTARRPQPAAAPHFPNAIYEGLKKRGIPDHVARGAAAGSFAEAAAGAGAVNPASGAMGIGQWLGSRKAGLIKRFGEHPNLDQQLDYLAGELKGGDAGGASVLAAKDEVEALNRYIRDFMRPAAGAETTGDLERGMAALGRGDEGLPAGGMAGPDYARSPDPEIARLRAEALQLGEAVIGIGRKPDGAAVNVYASRVPASRIGIDAERFQFKSGGDQYGVTDRLRGVEEIDPLALGRLTLWEAKDGRLFVADGHQRTGLVKRIDAAAGGDTIVDVGILREADGVSAEDARVMAALKNIGEDSGTAIDAAKIGRANAEALERAATRLPPRSPLVRDGRALAKLSDDAFGAVYNGLVPPDYAAVIGHLLPDRPELHAGIVDLLVKLDPANRGQAESIVRQAIAAGFEKAEQVELFGLRELNSSLFLERSKILEKGLAQLRKLRLVHKTAAESADTLEAAGSRIARGESAKEAKANGEAVEIVSRLAFSKGPIGDALNDGARSLANGGNLGNLARAFAERVRDLDLGELARLGTREAGSDASSRLVPDGAGRGGDAGDAGAAVRGEPEQPSLLELQAATERFSDPAGPAVQQQADSLTHDLKAELEAKAESGVLHGEASAMRPLEPAPDRSSAAASKVASEHYKDSRSLSRLHDAFVGGAAVARGERTEPFHPLRNAAEKEAFADGGVWASMEPANLDALGRRPGFRRIGENEKGVFENGEGERYALVDRNGAPFPNYGGMLVTVAAPPATRVIAAPAGVDEAMSAAAMFASIKDLPDTAASEDAIAAMRSRLWTAEEAAGRLQELNSAVDRIDEARERWAEQFADSRAAATTADRQRQLEIQGDQVAAIQEHLRQGGTVTSTTHTTQLKLTAAEHIRDRPSGSAEIMERGKWVAVPQEGLDRLAAQAGWRPANVVEFPSGPADEHFAGFVDHLQSLAPPELPRVKFRLDEEGDEISAEDLLAELEADEKAIKDIEDCL